MSHPRLENPIAWVDLEFTGLDRKNDRIIEYAMVVTSGDLTQSVVGPHGAIRTPLDVLNAMGEWCTNTHTATGLIDACLKSDVDMATAEQNMLSFLSKFGGAGTMRLGGSSVHVDRTYMQKDMPLLEKYFHYGIVDVSTIRHLVKMWRPDVEPYEGLKGHRALDDIQESIKQLQFLKRKVFDISS